MVLIVEQEHRPPLLNADMMSVTFNWMFHLSCVDQLNHSLLRNLLLALHNGSDSIQLIRSHAFEFVLTKRSTLPAKR